MRRRILPAALLAVAVTVLLPTSHAQARCNTADPRWAVCMATCAVYSVLEEVYC